MTFKALFHYIIATPLPSPSTVSALHLIFDPKASKLTFGGH